VWDAVEEQYNAGLLPPSFFTGKDRWLWRGQEYREIAEPLDIANWYMKNKQWQYKEKYGCVEEGYHYAQGIDTEEDELTVDNDRRPSRYTLLQRMERNALGSAAPSMGLARKLQAQLGNRKWQDVVPDAGLPDAGLPDAGLPDAGLPDAGLPDAGLPDAGLPDAGLPDAGLPSLPDAGLPGLPDAGLPGLPDAGLPDAGWPA
jgi:hypothetical protein